MENIMKYVGPVVVIAVALAVFTASAMRL